MEKPILTPKLAQKIQDNVFKKMTAVEKISLTSQLLELGKKLNTLNDRRKHGNHSLPGKNS